jgi:hypothetical protein
MPGFYFIFKPSNGSLKLFKISFIGKSDYELSAHIYVQASDEQNIDYWGWVKNYRILDWYLQN